MKHRTPFLLKFGAPTVLLTLVSVFGACSAEDPGTVPVGASAGSAGVGTGGSSGNVGTAGTSTAAGTGGVPGSSGSSGTGGAGSTGSGGAGTGGGAGSSGSAGSGGSAGSAVTSDGGANPALDQACTPDFTLNVTDKTAKAQVFTTAIPDPKAFVQEIGRGVCRILYRLPSEVRPANHVTLIIEDDPAGVAWKAGDVGDIDVGISTTHLTNVKNQGRDVAEEIRGILFHEMTHMYQNDDKPEATSPYLPNMYEGIADAVRIRAGHPPAGAQPSNKTGQWYQKTYTAQAFFWLFIDTKYPDFIYKLNLSMKKDGVPWTEASIQTITGQSASALWTEYGAASCCSGSNTSCCK